MKRESSCLKPIEKSETEDLGSSGWTGSWRRKDDLFIEWTIFPSNVNEV